MRLTTVSLILSIVSLVTPEAAEASVNLVWQRSLATEPRYVPGLNASERAAGLVFYYGDDDVLRRVDAQGAEVTVATTWPPIPQLGVSPARAHFGSPNGRFEVIFDADAVFSGENWELPIPQAKLHDMTGSVKATLSEIHDLGFLSNDGNVFVSVASGGIPAPETGPLPPNVLFFNGLGVSTGTQTDDDAHFATAALAENGSALVYLRPPAQIRALGPTGSILWTTPLATLAVVRLLDVSPTGSVVVVQGKKLEPPGSPAVVVLGSTGGLQCTATSLTSSYRTVRFTPDGARALLVNSVNAVLLDTATCTTIWTGTPAAGFSYYDGELTSSGVGIALSSKLSDDAPNYAPTAYPVQLTVDVVKMGTPVITETIVLARDDGGEASGPPLRGADLEVADDGAYLLIALPKGLKLYSTTMFPSPSRRSRVR